MTDRQRMHDGIMNWIRTSDRKPTVDDADESGTVWVYDRVFADVSSVHFYQTDSPYYTHWMPKEKRPAPPAPKEQTKESVMNKSIPAEAVVEAVARAICVACEENPDSQGDARGNKFRWQDYRDVALAAISAFITEQKENSND